MASPSLKLNSGYDMPLLGLGTWLSEPGEVKTAVKVALETGYRHIDCASGYGNEAEVGETLASAFSAGDVKREDVFITSKLWVKDFTQVKKACKLSLEKLQLKYLDLYLVHLPFELDINLPSLIPLKKGEGVIGYEPNRMLEVWKQMEELVADGLVRSIGLSNFTIHKIKELLDQKPNIIPANNQIELHPYLPQDRLVEYCNKNNISITAYSPLGNPGRPAEEVRENDPYLLGNDVVKSIAAKHKVTSAQVLLAWCLHRQIGVLVKSVKESRIKENFGSLNVKLDDEDLQTLNGIKTRARYLGQGWARKAHEEVEDLWDGEYLG